jgi:hypothetical protein
LPTISKAHVIDEYKVRANTILCICGWKGDADEDWKKHKYDSRKTQEKVDEMIELVFRPVNVIPIVLRENEEPKKNLARVRVQNKSRKIKF